MRKMILSLIITLSVCSSGWAESPQSTGHLYTVYPLRNCVTSAAHFVRDTAKGVVKGAVTVVEGTWGIVTAPFRVEWKKPTRRYFFCRPAEVHYHPAQIYEIMPPDLVIELE